MKLCLNGHEWLKRPLAQRGVPFEPLDNGIRSSDAPARVPRIVAQAALTAGAFSMWRPDGKELYDIDPSGRMMAAAVTVSGALLTPGMGQTTRTSIVVVNHWFENAAIP